MLSSDSCTITGVRRCGRNHIRLRLRAPHIAREALPGQFVNVRCTSLEFGERVFATWQDLLARRREMHTRLNTLLLRPFAVHRKWTTGPRHGQIEILFKVVGHGTAALAARKPGDRITLLGPLGRGFDLSWCQKLSTATVVAGGVGVAPLYSLVQYLRRHHVRTLLILGAMSEQDIPLETADSRVTLSFMASRPEVTLTAGEFARLGCQVGIVTMEGKKGYVGLPTEMLDRFLHATDRGARGETGVFACGPWAMLREVAKHSAEHHLRCQVLLEERMGCGIGACMACSRRMKRANGTPVRKRVCVDGPVFDASEVLWDEE